MKRALTVAAALVMLLAATPAQARIGYANRICHDGTWLQPSVNVHEKDGSRYWVRPGKCTPGDVPILAMRPVSSDAACTYNRVGEKKKRTLRWGSSWTLTLGHSITIQRCWYNYGE